MIPLDPTALVLPTVLVATVLALGTGGLALTLMTRLRRLPAAVTLEDVEERVARGQVRLREIEAAIHERDRYAAEVLELKGQVESLRAQLATLEPSRAEIEQVKAEAAAAAADLATSAQKLEEKRAALAEAEQVLDRWRRLREEVERLETERGRLEDELPQLRAEAEAARRALAEAGGVEARHAALETRAEELRDEIARLREECHVHEKTRTELDQTRAEADRIRSEVDRLSHLKMTLTAEVSRLEGNRREYEELEKAVGVLGERLRVANETIAAAEEAQARRIALEEQIETLRRGIDTHVGRGPNSPGTAPDPDELLADLRRQPLALREPSRPQVAPPPEIESLDAVARSLRESALSFSERTLRAFHTSLKINDHAQLTVLAGVSGTGKSLLPRRYAEAMGIHFLQIAVEPRWDSPQDLLGFYNYVEKNYRATELARLLFHMDRWRDVELPEGVSDRSGHLSLVLLDEMNLARVEYYFSEFLSRLEARPPFQQVRDPSRRRDALIPLDIRGLGQPVSLFPAHNVLFAGTMNDDESTQALADKVLDRSNVLQFAAPKEFEPARPLTPVVPASEALPFVHWRRWIRPAGDVPEPGRGRAREVIGKLADIMESCGRPFGFRLRDAIFAYVANYPREGNAAPDVAVPLADQIEFRILPKLRGLEIETHQSQLDDLQKLVRHELHDSVFGDRIEELVEQQKNGAGLFVWRGLRR